MATLWRRLTFAIRSLLGPAAEAETRARLLGLPAPVVLPSESAATIGGQDAARAASRSALVAWPRRSSNRSRSA